MKKLVIVMLILAGCSRGGEQNQAAETRDQPQVQRAPEPATSLTGLYEGGNSDRPNQLCIVEDGKGAPARFGLVVWGGGLHSCSGTGTTERQGDRLTLTMAGDETCTIEAKMEDDTLVLPASAPEGCAYYCGARATLADARFARTGTTPADARKARDLVGDPLCGSE